MDEPRQQEAAERPRVDAKKTALACGLILLLAGGIAALTFLTEPTAKRGGATKQTAMLVEVARAERGTFRPTILATGSVEPEQDVVLSPQVAGVVQQHAPELVAGGFVDEGQLLVRIEPADYRNALQQARSTLQQAKAELRIEMGRQRVAQRDYELFGQGLPSAQEGLMLREPQLQAARVRVEAAQSGLEQAKLELRRTTIEAPFAAHVLRRDVDVGSRVSPGDPLARLLGVERYWVVANVPLRKLRFLSVPEGPGDRGSPARVRNRGAWPEGAYRTGYVSKVIGALDDRTRLARVLVAIPDPLARKAPDKPALMVGAFVETRIVGEPIEDVVRLDRDYLRDGDTVWVMQDERLDIREVEVVVRDAEHAYIAAGLAEGERVVTSNLATVTQGARLRVQGAEAAP